MSDIDDRSASVDAARFRQVMGHFPTGVTVVTTLAEGKPAGLAVGSFCSVSLDPPLVLFCAAAESTTFAKIRQTGVFCVNILSETQEETCRVFAGQSEDKFAGMGWRPSANGSPVLDGVLAFVDCTVDQLVEAGDHSIVVGAVGDVEVLHEGGPLLFFRSGFGRFTP